MPIRLLGVAIIVLLVLYLLRRLLTTQPQAITAALRRGLPFFAVALLVVLAVTGHLNWLFAAIASLFAALPRFLPLARHIPLLRKFYQRYKSHQHNRADQTGQEHPGSRPRDSNASGRMSENEAYKILGLEPGASREQIIASHRQLIQKLHPDRGGSSYLATKLNEARETLLEHETASGSSRRT